MVYMNMYDKDNNRQFKLEHEYSKARNLLIKCYHSNHLCCVDYCCDSSYEDYMLSAHYNRQFNRAIKIGIITY